ncbi:hypothetical protein HN51_061594 [Arachis hypogaea]
MWAETEAEAKENREIEEKEKGGERRGDRETKREKRLKETGRSLHAPDQEPRAPRDQFVNVGVRDSDIVAEEIEDWIEVRGGVSVEKLREHVDILPMEERHCSTDLTVKSGRLFVGSV